MSSVAGKCEPFSGSKDRYGGVTVTSSEEPCSQEEFPARLSLSLSSWAQDKVRSVWFHVSPSEADWVPTLCKQGFNFHHANPQRVALLKWIETKEKCNVPPYAHTLVGVGGMVVTEEGQVLVVQERFYVQPHWKLPGGYLDPGEDIAEAAIREVLEETGIKTEFRSIVAFRHGHNFNFGCSDIYIIVALRPLSMEISKCNKEISKCEWMSLQEYMEHPLVHATNRHFAQQYLECTKTGAFIGKNEIERKIKDIVRKEVVYSLQHQDS